MPINYQISLTGDCSNTNSGELSLSLIGTAPYSITWDLPISITQTGQTSPYTYGGLSAGTYSLTVTDSSPGPQIQNVSFVIFSSSTASILGITNPSCGNNSGTISVGTTAITNSYTYNFYRNNEFYSGFTNQSSQLTFGNFPSGLYYCEVIPLGGCPANTQNVILNDTQDFDFGFYIVNNPICTPSQLGRVVITGLTGTPPYTYQWNGVGLTGITSASTITGLSQGSYSVFVTDSAGCSKSKTAIVGSGTIITPITTIVTQPTCNQSDGSAICYFTGGTPPYMYTLSNGEQIISYSSTVEFQNLSTGNYTVGVTDVSLCTSSTGFRLTTPNAFTVTKFTSTNSLCSHNDGTISVNLQGGNTPYHYVCTSSDGNTTYDTFSNITSNTFRGLSSDTWSLSISDSSSSCGFSTDVVITNEPSFNPVITYTATTCGYNNGVINVVIESSTTTGDTYQYSLSNGFTSPITSVNSYTFNRLRPGTYTLSITKTNQNCTQSFNIVILSSSAPNVRLFPTSCLGGSGGTVSLLIQEENGPYTYTWSNNVNGQTGLVVTGLTAGTYSVTVSGTSGCVFLASTNVTCNPLVTSTGNTITIDSGTTVTASPYFSLSDMVFSGYTSLTQGSSDCVYRSSFIFVKITLGGTEYLYPFHYSTSLTDVPTNAQYYDFLTNTILSLPYITNCIIDQTTNTIDITSQVVNGIEIYRDEDLSVDIQIQYDIDCLSTDGIICNCLVLRLEGDNTQSYPGSGSVWYDLSGNGNNCILSGGSYVFTGDYGGGVTLNDSTSTDGFLQLPSTASLNLETLGSSQNYTVIMAFRKEYYSSVGGGISQLLLGSDDNITTGWGIYEDSTGTSGTSFDNVYNIVYGSPSSGNSFTQQVYENIVLGVFSRSSNQLVTNINGVVNTTTLSSTYSNGTDISTFGQQLNGFGTLNGSIFLLYIYNRALSETEVNTAYNSLKGKYQL
jgi:hypothetical protein